MDEHQRPTVRILLPTRQQKGVAKVGEQGGEEGAALAMGGQVCLWGSMGTQERCCSSWKRANRRVEGRRQRVRALYSCARVQRFDGLVETIAKLNETASGSGGEIQAYDEPDSEFFDCQEGPEQAAVAGQCRAGSSGCQCCPAVGQCKRQQ